MISFRVEGDTKKTDAFLDAMIKGDLYSSVERHARAGVDALSHATPEESGLTADSWTYEIEKRSGSYVIWFKNTHVVDGFNVAVGLQYGHATGNGGWVQGYDYINPALKPVFDKIADDVWKEVQKA